VWTDREETRNTSRIGCDCPSSLARAVTSNCSGDGYCARRSHSRRHFPASRAVGVGSKIPISRSESRAGVGTASGPAPGTGFGARPAFVSTPGSDFGFVRIARRQPGGVRVVGLETLLANDPVAREWFQILMAQTLVVAERSAGAGTTLETQSAVSVLRRPRLS
jgi:hypothetical protein